jgi:hypothetical protein
MRSQLSSHKTQFYAWAANWEEIRAFLKHFFKQFAEFPLPTRFLGWTLDDGFWTTG